MDRPLSAHYFQRALNSIPGGVNSPVRSFAAMGLPPVIASHGSGAHLFDIDGNAYVDHLLSWGAIILGHAFPEVSEAIAQTCRRGTGFGLSHPAEADLAELVIEAFPSIERLRLVNSGTEAVMSAVRVARGFTGRDKVLMFEGCYHGHSDALLVKAGSGLATFGISSSAGVPSAFTGQTLLARYNDLESVTDAAGAHGDDIACVLVEPVAGNMGVVAPEPGFLEGLREVCDRVGALLIFDEVITGFRVAWGGAQERFGVRPDITTLGKILGAGLPVGAYGARAEIMQRLAPLGDVYQAGTLSGNPVVVSAGKAALEVLRRLNPYDQLERNTRRLAEAIRDAARTAGVSLQVNQVGSMFTVFFADGPVKDYGSARAADPAAFQAFFGAMLNRGVLLPPSQWEAAFLSTAHGDEELAHVTAAAAVTLAEVGGRT